MGKHVRRTQKNVGLRTVIPLSNNLTLLLGLTLSSPGSGLQETSWEHFCQSLINAKIALILSVFLTGPQRFLFQKGKFHIKSKKWKSVLWNLLIRQALISSDKHRDANNKLLTHPEGSIWYLPLSILIEMINFKKLEEKHPFKECGCQWLINTSCEGGFPVM